jgi:hypothetical protein
VPEASADISFCIATLQGNLLKDTASAAGTVTIASWPLSSEYIFQRAARFALLRFKEGKLRTANKEGDASSSRKIDHFLKSGEGSRHDQAETGPCMVF